MQARELSENLSVDIDQDEVSDMVASINERIEKAKKLNNQKNVEKFTAELQDP